MSLPVVVMCSMWKNDIRRSLVNRAQHLLSKADAYAALRFVWIVGDSDDETAEVLRTLTCERADVQVIDIGDTGMKGDDADSRLRRLSATGNHFLKHADGADYMLIHESDIISPPDLVARLVAHAEQGRCPIAAWPTLEIYPGVKWFYDVWAYRKDGVRFKNKAPYHECYRADKPFIVDSAGTILMFHAADASECIMSKQAVLDLCWHLRDLGRDIWVDPTLEVVQPRALWEYHHIEKETA
jgi:hypothetical protein